MEQDSQRRRWEGKVSAKLKIASAEQAWSLLKDFFNFHKWFPTLSVCYGTHGSNGVPGCIRYCAGSSIPSNAAAATLSWSKERLIAVDDVDRSLAYEIVDSNIGFNSYHSTIRVLSLSDGPSPGPQTDTDRSNNGCAIEWSFAVDPVEGWVLEDLVSKYQPSNKHIPKRHMAEESKSTWEGKASAELTGTTADQVWPLLEDFCSINKWFPIDTCYQVEGVANQPGLIRHCSVTATATAAATTTTDDADQPERISTMWAEEKLLSMDPIQRCLTYELVDNNMGLKSYVATVKVLPIISDDKPAECCRIELSFVCDPGEGWTFEGFFSYIQSSVQSMAKKMELAFSA